MALDPFYGNHGNRLHHCVLAIASSKTLDELVYPTALAHIFNHLMVRT